MTRRLLAVVGVSAGALVLAAIVAPSVAAQAPGATSAPAASTSASFRTVWGDPDLQGIWTGTTLTPMERPKEFADKEFLTEAEVAALEKKAAAGTDHWEYQAEWWDSATKWVPSRRTSLVVTPSNGRIPMRIEHDAGTLTQGRAYGTGPYNTYVDLDTGERCLGDGMPQIWQGYNPNHQIFQTRGYVVILHEMFRERRIIPIGERPRAEVYQWNGQPRGWWEGDTLVVETTHFPDRPTYRWASVWRAPTRTLHVVERFTRADKNTINYRATITDPAKFNEPWTVDMPLTSDQSSRGVTSGKLLEFACHEGNYGLENVLRSARAEEKAAEEAKKTGTRE